MKINKTDFNPVSIKKMGFYKFKTNFSHLLGMSAEDAWFKITGKQVKQKAVITLEEKNISQDSINDALSNETKDE